PDCRPETGAAVLAEVESGSFARRRGHHPQVSGTGTGRSLPDRQTVLRGRRTAVGQSAPAVCERTIAPGTNAEVGSPPSAVDFFGQRGSCRCGSFAWAGRSVCILVGPWQGSSGKRTLRRSPE